MADRSGRRSDAISYKTCPCAEAAEQYGVNVHEIGLTHVRVPDTSWAGRYGGGSHPLGGLFPAAVGKGLWDLAAWTLDRIDDCALDLKRRAVEPLRAGPDGRGDP